MQIFVKKYAMVQWAPAVVATLMAVGIRRWTAVVLWWAVAGEILVKNALWQTQVKWNENREVSCLRYQAISIYFYFHCRRIWGALWWSKQRIQNCGDLNWTSSARFVSSWRYAYSIHDWLASGQHGASAVFLLATRADKKACFVHLELYAFSPENFII